MKLSESVIASFIDHDTAARRVFFFRPSHPVTRYFRIISYLQVVAKEVGSRVGCGDLWHRSVIAKDSSKESILVY